VRSVGSRAAASTSYVSQLIAQTSPHEPDRVSYLWYVDDGNEQPLTVPAAGLLGQLARLADELSKEYRWRPSEATMSVLSGRTPEVFVYVSSAEVPRAQRHDLSNDDARPLAQP